MSKSTTVISQKKKRGPAPTGKGEPVLTRLQDDLLGPLDQYASEQPDTPGRPEAIRRILRDRLVDDEDAIINALYKTGEPGVGAAFMKAIINHLRTYVRNNPNVTVDECKEFVLDLFNNYDQDLEEHIQALKHGKP